MSNRPILDPVEAALRDLRGAVYAADGHISMAATERRPDLHTLQYVGDGLRLALAQGVTGAAPRAGQHIAALRNRDLDGDEDLAIELEAAPGQGPTRVGYRRIIGTFCAQSLVLNALRPSPFLARRLPKHVRCRLRYSPADSCLGTIHAFQYGASRLAYSAAIA